MAVQACIGRKGRACVWNPGYLSGFGALRATKDLALDTMLRVCSLDVGRGRWKGLVCGRISLIGIGWYVGLTLG